MPDNKTIAASVLEAVGGKENVTSVVHCMTRLRFTLKDNGIPNINTVKKIKGVLGAQESGGQFQIIIGQNVGKVYDEVCALGGFARKAAIDENLDIDRPKQKLTPKVAGKNILNYLSGSMVPMIPVLLCAGLFRTVQVVLGSTMLGVITDESDLAILMNMLYNAGFYFLPIYLGYNAAKQIGATPMLGAFMGGILIEPSFMQMATEGTSFTVFGIPCTPGTYSQTVVPILLSVPVLYLFERLFKRVLPDTLATIFTPFLSMLLTVPFSLCLLAPLGTWLGSGISTIFSILGSSGGFVSILAAALLSAVWNLLIITGMHVTIIVLAISSFMATGQDTYVLAITTIIIWTLYGMELACWMKLRNHEDKSEALGFFISHIVGGVSEPFYYGMMFRYRRLFPVSIAGCFITGAIGSALGLTTYMLAGSNALNILAYVGGDTSNMIAAIVTAVAGFIIGFALTFFFGFTEDELEHGPESERA